MAATKSARKWTKQELAILKSRYAKDGPTKLCKAIGCSYWTLLSKAKRMGLESTRKSPPKNFCWTSEIIAKIKARYVQEGARELAKEFGLSESAVSHKAGKLGLKTKAGHVRAGIQKSLNSTSYDIKYFDVWSPNMAYILGFLFADGSINKRGTQTIILIHKKDKCVLNFVRKELKTKSRIYDYYSSGNVLCINSTYIVNRLQQLGIKKRKSFVDHEFPDVPNDMLPHFIRGYLDGDGSISVDCTGRCGVNFVGAPTFIRGLRDRLSQAIPIKSDGAIKVQQGKTTKFAYVAWSALNDLRKIYDYLYRDKNEFCLQRKRKVLEKWLSVPRYPHGTFFGNQHTGSLYRSLNSSKSKQGV